MRVLIEPASSDRPMTTHRRADIHTRCGTSCPICRTPIRADEGRPRRVHVIEVASIDALPPEHIVTGDAPQLCAEAPHWNDVKRPTAPCGKRVLSASLQPACPARIEHPPPPPPPSI